MRLALLIVHPQANVRIIQESRAQRLAQSLVRLTQVVNVHI